MNKFYFKEFSKAGKNTGTKQKLKIKQKLKKIKKRQKKLNISSLPFIESYLSTMIQ